MKKFLVVLALVLCMALPAAAAETWTVTNCTSDDKTDIYYAVEHANSGDTIVVAASIDLEDYHDGHGLIISSDSVKNLTLHINDGCTLSASDLNPESTICISVEDNINLTITGNGTISSTNTDTRPSYGVAYAIYADNSKVTIKGNVTITANGKGESDGIVVSGASSDVRIFGGTVSGDFLAGDPEDEDKGTITLYDLTWLFNDGSGNGAKFGPDSTYDYDAINANKLVITNNTKITFDPVSLDVTQGTETTQVVSVDLLCASGDLNPLSNNKIEVVSPSVDGITVTPSSDGTITFKIEANCAVGSYDFSVLRSAETQNSNLDTGMYSKILAQIETFTVYVKQGSGGGSSSKSGGSSGGCNAGFGAAALAALAVMTVVKRRKK